MRGSLHNIEFSAQFYDTIRAVIRLGFLINNKYEINLKRDNSFSTFSGYVFDEDGEPVAGAYVKVENIRDIADSDGHFTVTIPVEVQSEFQQILIVKLCILDADRISPSEQDLRKSLD